MQSDLDANGFRILNLGGGGAQSGSVYVDALLGDDTTGEIGTSNPFQTLEAALTAAPAGYNIVMRPGTYQFDGSIEVPRQVNIFGYGAIISPLTEGVACGLLITASRVKIYGLEFDGGIQPVDAVNDDTGVVIVNGGTSVLLRDLSIHNQNGVGIELRDRYDLVTIENSTIQTCYRGVTGAIGTSSISDINCRNSFFQANRHEGIKYTGIDNAGGVALRNIRIQNNEFTTNDTQSANKAAINIDAGAIDLVITGNSITTHYDSIVVKKILRGVIGTNFMNGASHNHITVVGHKRLDIVGNIIDGANPTTDANLTEIGIDVSGDYATTDDSGPLVIVGNIITRIDPSGTSISLGHANTVNVASNQFQRMTVAAYASVQISANTINVDTNGIAITLDAAGRASTGCTISANRFYVTGSPTRLIGTADASSAGHSGIQIVGNTSTHGKTYSNGIFSNVSGAAPTSVYIQANTPPSPTASNVGGWVNDEKNLPNQVIVSQERGINSTATRESDAHPFLTIAAAMTAAVSGDTIYVKDGVFDELITAKDGVTVRFLPEAVLNCVAANGCVQSGADGDEFSLYHEHAPITSDKTGKANILIGHTGQYNFYLGGIANTGANSGTLANAIVTSGTTAGDVLVNLVPGSRITSDNAHAVVMQTGVVKIYANGGELFGGISAVTVSSTGIVNVKDARIYSSTEEPVNIGTAVGRHIYKRCSIESFESGFAAVKITGTNTNAPVFHDCILISEGTATQSMNVTGAHDVTIMGYVTGNKGSAPPTNVTFQGGGVYAVDADVFPDF